MKKRLLFGIILAWIILNLFLVSAGELRVTQEHPFLVNGEWIEASQLQVGDKLTTADGKTATITSIREVFETVDVFNLEASSFSNFVLEDGIVVHNSDLPELYSCPNAGRCADYILLRCPGWQSGECGMMPWSLANYFEKVVEWPVSLSYRGGNSLNYLPLRGWRECAVRVTGRELFDSLSAATENLPFRKFGAIAYKDVLILFPVVEEAPASLFVNPTTSDVFIALLREDRIQLDIPRVYSMFNLKPKNKAEIRDLWMNVFSSGKSTFMKDAVFFEGAISKDRIGEIIVDVKRTGYLSELQDKWKIKPDVSKAYGLLRNGLDETVELRFNLP